MLHNGNDEVWIESKVTSTKSYSSGGSRAAATSKMERSILDVAAVLYPPLIVYSKNMKYVIKFLE